MTEANKPPSYRSITTANYPAPTLPYEPGPAPNLQWIEIAQLVVDPSYQRDIGRQGRFNVKRITEGFEWSKFAPVVVAPIEGGACECEAARASGRHSRPLPSTRPIGQR